MCADLTSRVWSVERFSRAACPETGLYGGFFKPFVPILLAMKSQTVVEFMKPAGGRSSTLEEEC